MIKSHKLDGREIATILAALRYYQNDMEESARLADEDCGRERLSPDVDPDGDLHMIATDCGMVASLSVNEIEELCQRLNA